MRHMGLKICVGDYSHRYYKHTKFCQNPRGDPKFLVDLTRNDPYVTYGMLGDYCAILQVSKKAKIPGFVQ